jgi:D-threo-aldose 1-dehydrogenase
MSSGENPAVAGPFERAQLGRSGVWVTRLELGCAPIAGLYAPVSEDDAADTLQAAWDGGIRAFDTAPLYGSGLSESRLGAFLRSKDRETFTVTTKVGRLLASSGEGSSPGTAAPGLAATTPDYSAEGVERSLEASLARMGLDRVDVVLVHDPDNYYEQALYGAFPALHKLRAAGVIGAVGAGMNQSEMLERFVRDADIDCVLVAGRYTMLDDRAAASLLPACAERGVGVVVGGVFNSGILARPVPGAHFDYRPANTAELSRAQKLREVVMAHGVSLAAAAIQYPRRDKRVTAIAVGARSAAEVREDIAHYTTPIPDALWSDLQSSGLLGWRGFPTGDAS